MKIKVPLFGVVVLPSEFALSVVAGWRCNEFALGVVMIILFLKKIKSESGACRWLRCVCVVS